MMVCLLLFALFTSALAANNDEINLCWILRERVGFLDRDVSAPAAAWSAVLPSRTKLLTFAPIFNNASMASMQPSGCSTANR
jgi:hypothetical protein